MLYVPLRLCCPDLRTPAFGSPGPRCCTLEFHPRRDNIVVSGDKKGAIAVWDFDKVRGTRIRYTGTA